MPILHFQKNVGHHRLILASPILGLAFCLKKLHPAQERLGDNLTIEVDLIQAIAMHVGLRFAIREGGRTCKAL